ncbi:BrnT family toxin [Pseudomonas protegens]
MTIELYMGKTVKTSSTPWRSTITVQTVEGRYIGRCNLMSKTCSICTFMLDTSGLIPSSKLPDGVPTRCMKEDKANGGWPPPIREPLTENCEKFTESSPMRSRWEWDDNKNITNMNKHGISFADAVSALDSDENSLRYVAKSWESLDSLDFEAKGIQRTLANTDPVRDQHLFKFDGKVWLLVSTLRGEVGLMTQRVISVRRARPDELKLYEQGFGTY